MLAYGSDLLHLAKPRLTARYSSTAGPQQEIWGVATFTVQMEDEKAFITHLGFSISSLFMHPETP